MLFTLFLAFVLLIVVFSRTTPRNKNIPILKQYRKMIIVALTMLVTILVMNIIRPRVFIEDLDEIIELADEDEDEYHSLSARQSKSEQDPGSIPKLLEYSKFKTEN